MKQQACRNTEKRLLLYRSTGSLVCFVSSLLASNKFEWKASVEYIPCQFNDAGKVDASGSEKWRADADERAGASGERVHHLISSVLSITLFILVTQMLVISLTLIIIGHRLISKSILLCIGAAIQRQTRRIMWSAEVRRSSHRATRLLLLFVEINGIITSPDSRPFTKGGSLCKKF